jgi:multidrug resistance efflux pump
MAVVRVTASGRLVLVVDEDSVLEMEETCALRAAESGAHQYDEIAKRLGLAEEYVEEIAFFALAKLGRARDLTDAGLVVEANLATARAKRQQQEARNRAKSNSSRAERDRMGGST